MENNVIMKKFNEYLDYRQELQFLNGKYADVLRLDEKEKSKLQILLEKNQFKKTVYDDIINHKKGLMDILDSLGSEEKIKLFLGILFFSKDGFNSDIKNVYILKIESIIFDYKKYSDIKHSLNELQSGTTEGEKNKVLFSFLSKVINQKLKGVLEGKETLTKKEQEIIVNGFQQDEDIFSKIIFPENIDGNQQEKNSEDNISKNTLEKINISSSLKKKIDSFLDKIVYFHTIQTIYRKYNYILTFEDIGRLKKIMKEIEQGKMVFLSGDTGSGKTELTLLIANLYIEQKNKQDGGKRKTPILVGGHKETDLSDFTLEKIITSRSGISNKNDLVTGEEHFDMERKLLDQIININELKENIYEQINNLQIPEDKKVILKENVNNIDFTKYNIFTEYHLKGLFKAMYEGVPFIIDEMNAIRPEILIGLNHYLTRKIGQNIELPNGLGSFTIKDGFCIMCSGNDKDANIKKEMYMSRYTIDESLINRMTILSKGYMEQVHDKFSNINSSELKEKESFVDYLTENEIYGTLLMFFFQGKEDQKKELAFIKNSKMGFDLMKEEFIGKNDQEKKEIFFGNMKKFAHFIKLIQNAYEQKGSVMCDNQDISNFIKRRVISMRQIKAIITNYQKDTKSLFYHIYDNLLSHGGGSEEEKIGMLYALKEVGLLPIITSGSLNIQGEGLKRIDDMLKKIYLQEKNSDNNENLNIYHDKKIIINKDILESRLILTKQDIYKEYFGKTLDNITDEEIIGENKEILDQISLSGTNEGEEKGEEIIDENRNIEEIKEQSEQILAILGKEQSNFFLKKLQYKTIYILKCTCQKIIDAQDKDFDQTKINDLFVVLNKILLYLGEGITNKTFDEQKFIEVVHLLHSLTQ